MPMIELEHVSKTFVTKSGTHKALDDVSLSVADGDIYGIIGPSGAGKSTLVRCINLLEHPTSGSVIIDGTDVTGYGDKQARELRRHVGMIFQNFDLYAQRTVLQNVTFPLELQHVKRADRLARAHELLEMVGLSDKERNYPSQLSGGQQQRVAIARALANRPKVLLCDEATSALDTISTISVLKLLKRVNRELGITLVVITHAMNVVEAICNKVSVIEDGAIVEQGAVADVFSNPQQEITKQLLGKVNWDE
jgi:D-methionine transport system ATP-binding protein